tara:strand:- start:151 stop:621 length:471 start_codon:yes stop_codon:yes gene_type:complete
MGKPISKLLTILIFLHANSIHASENRCNGIKDADKKSECFDGKSKQKMPPNRGSNPTANEAISAESPKEEKYIGNRAKSLFDWKGTEPFISKIKKIRSREKQRMVFLLNNDQIWIQIEPRFQPFKEGEQVYIQANFTGGFNMRSESGAFTEIRRIQ